MGRNSVLGLSLLAILFLSVSPAFARPIQLINFNGLQDMQQVGNFYNGGGPSNVPNLGISFSSNFYGLRSECATTIGNCIPGGQGSGAFLPDPTQTPAIFILGTPGTMATGYMNVDGEGRMEWTRTPIAGVNCTIPGAKIGFSAAPVSVQILPSA